MLGPQDPEDINFETLLLHVLKCEGCLKIGFKFPENIDKREMNKLFSYATQYVEDTKQDVKKEIKTVKKLIIILIATNVVLCALMILVLLKKK